MRRLGNIQLASLAFIPTWGAAMLIHHNFGSNNVSAILYAAPFFIIGGMIAYAKLKK